MPAPQLHLTFADEMRRAATAEPRCLRLGSIFHDLAYYGNVPLMAIRYGLRRPAEPSVWGYRIHYDRPDSFLARFIETAHGYPGAARAGFVADIAFDGSLAEPLGIHGPSLPTSSAAA